MKKNVTLFARLWPLLGRLGLLASCSLSLLASCAKAQNQNTQTTIPPLKEKVTMSATATPIHTDTATFGAGCFWCVEAVFQQLNGVQRVQSGYAGGTVKNPSYKEVCTGTTGHAEVCQIIYDPTVVSYEDLLQAFWQTHDPTTLNKQGHDEGTQYRSVIFYHNEQQHILAEKYKKELTDQNVWGNPIVTEISAMTTFYPAEDYHQNYYIENGSQPYCSVVIRPKVEKFQKVFKDKLKK